MKIAVIGFGQTGSRVAELAATAGHSVVVIDPQNKLSASQPFELFAEINKTSLMGVEVAIDFTSPRSALANCKLLAEHDVAVVMGTTGWYSDIEQMRRIVEKAGIGFVYAQNFSIGVALYLKVLRQSAKLFADVVSYDVAALEFHHAQKQDSPSGTGLAVANALLENMPRKTALVTDKLDRKPESHELHLASLRCGHIPGTHSVIFDSPQDSITITHEARNRDGFAAGAIKAAELLAGKIGFFSFDELLEVS
jgi:4-hydroxy-tetrahydrodipicolinate reductase